MGSVTTLYVFNPASQVLHETDANLNFNAHYIYLGGQLISEMKNSTTYFPFSDHLGSARLLTGMNQSVVQNVDYLPFGEASSSSASVPIVNPGFESGGSGWVLGFWGCTSNVTTAQAHSGSYSLAQTGSTTGGSYQDFDGVVSGNNYQCPCGYARTQGPPRKRCFGYMTLPEATRCNRPNSRLALLGSKSA